ncbi:MAG: hypothetical protein ACKOU7_09140 [Ferruginibacter sp.]
MKTTFTPMLLLAGLFSFSIILNSCSKADTSSILPKEQQVVGEWVINRVQLRLYQNGVFIRDTIIKSTPKPKNFVRFGADGSFEYKLNSTTSDVGTYEFAGSGSLITNSSPKSYNWTMLTLTNVLFTLVSKGSDPAFPGYYVERYQTFTR